MSVHSSFLLPSIIISYLLLGTLANETLPDFFHYHKIASDLVIALFRDVLYVIVSLLSGSSSARPDLPPTKRRRGLAGSIVSTAWSAALMGTAVGLTVYRLWRDRGRGTDDFDPTGATPTRKRRASADPDDMSMSEPPSPPPPYNQEWTAVDYPNSTHPSRPVLNVTVPATPRGRDREREKANKPKPTPRSAKKGGSLRAYQGRTRKAAPFVRPVAGPSSHHPETSGDSVHELGGYNQPTSYAGSLGRASGRYLRPDQGLNPPVAAEEEDVEDQMDWIGGKLAQLIEEGKRALGTEVVVMSEAREDEVDDGAGGWVSDDDESSQRANLLRKGTEVGGGASLKRRGSTASARYHHQHQHQLHGRSVAASASSTSVNQYSQVSVTPPRQTYGGLGSMPASPVRSHHLVEDPCESPEVREMMERARAKLASRAFR